MQRLKREVGVFGAVWMGLGSIVGTGVFVSIGIAAGIAGPATIPAVGVAALLALCNGLSSAQLAAAHPVSGGTYEYGYRFLVPLAGFLAGWLFLVAKSASAATAALGFAGYLLSALRVESSVSSVALAIVAVGVLSVIVRAGLRRSSLTNVIIVSVTLTSLLVFVARTLPAAIESASTNLTPFFESPDALAGPAGSAGPADNGSAGPADNGSAAGSGLRPAGTRFFAAAALLFVAYTGYGRIATLGEEVKAPRATIPRAIVVTLLLVMVLYGAVAFTAIAGAGAATLAGAVRGSSAPLEAVSWSLGQPVVARIVALGAVTAMLGVLLNLILGLSRVLLAMGRRGDMPRVLGRLDRRGSTPANAVVVVGLVIAVIALTGNVALTWSFSAFSVLAYYALTNLAALFIPKEARLFPRWVSVLGLIGCASLAWFVETRVWVAGLGAVLCGVAWFAVARYLPRRRAPHPSDSEGERT